MMFYLFRETAIRAALLLALVACCGTVFAQQGNDGLVDSNMLWQEKVWRTMDCREAQNKPLMKVRRGDSTQPFTTVLLDLIKSDAIKAHDPAFENLPYFPLMLPYDSAWARLGVTGDSIPECVDIRIVEDWKFSRKEGQMVVTILRLTPVFRLPDASGNIVDSPLFWVSYPDCRKHFRDYTVVKGGTGPDITLEEYFESRQFSSRITKVSPPFPSSQPGVDVIEEGQGRFDYEAPERKHRRKRR